MRNTTLALSCFLLAGAAFAQQSTPASSPSPAAAKAAPTSTATAAAKPPANPLTDAQAKQMLELVGALEMKDQLEHSIMAYFQHNMPFLPKDVSDDLEQSVGKLDLETPIIALYKQHISAEDADSIIAFYKTPAGKDMIQTLPELLQQSQQIGLQMGRKTAQEVVARHRPEIEAAAKQYQQDHAPKPAPSLNRTPAATPNAAPDAKPSSTSPATTAPQPN
jgi:uncharacterized protein